jgi:endogenous inhibitor of DNA gyrase (YacG/DUF329 family)
MPDDVLRECPFCGRDVHIDPPSTHAPEITCTRCNVLMGNLSTRQKLIATWNSRFIRIAKAPGVIPAVFKE